MATCPLCSPAKIPNLVKKVVKNPDETITLNVHELYESIKKIREEARDQGYKEGLEHGKKIPLRAFS